MTPRLDTAERGPLETTDGHPRSHLRQERYGAVDYDDRAPIEPQESDFRHSGWATQRRRILASLRRTGAGTRRIQNFCDCGSGLWLHRDGTELALTCNRCHDRLCLPCQRERQQSVVEGVLLKMIDCPADCRFVTLTLKHGDSPLSDQIDRLLACFKLLRHSANLKSKMVGGVWFLEVKLSKDLARWHPHLHVIVEGSFIEKKALSAAWLAATGDSYIVDIQKIDDRRKRAQYVAKYSTKPLHPDVVKIPAKLDEFTAAIKGRRLYQCFGTWSRAVKKESPGRRNLTPIGSLSTVHSNALDGDVASLVWMHQAHARWPRLARTHPLPAQPSSWAAAVRDCADFP